MFGLVLLVHIMTIMIYLQAHSPTTMSYITQIKQNIQHTNSITNVYVLRRNYMLIFEYIFNA